MSNPYRTLAEVLEQELELITIYKKLYLDLSGIKSIDQLWTEEESQELCHVINSSDYPVCLEDSNLERVNLTGANLTMAYLKGANLEGAYLRKENLQGANLEEAHLGPMYLKEVNLEGANLSGADLSGANLSEANLSGAILIKAYLTGANLSEANLKGANLSGAILVRGNWSPANLTGAYLEGANLKGADLSGANLKGAYLTEADMTEARLEKANLIGAHLEGAILTKAILKMAKLVEVHLEGMILTEVDLEGAYLTGANLKGASLRNANLLGAHLEGANLTGADLSGADLSGANLEGADLTGANLSGANLKGAKLKGAILTNADLRNVQFGIMDFRNRVYLVKYYREEAFKSCIGIKPKIPADQAIQLLVLRAKEADQKKLGAAESAEQKVVDLHQLERCFFLQPQEAAEFTAALKAIVTISETNNVELIKEIAENWKKYPIEKIVKGLFDQSCEFPEGFTRKNMMEYCYELGVQDQVFKSLLELCGRTKQFKLERYELIESDLSPDHDNFQEQEVLFRIIHDYEIVCEEFPAIDGVINPGRDLLKMSSEELNLR